jgi:hypothetical protein
MILNKRWLFRFTSVAAFVVGVFLILGGAGHLQAIYEQIQTNHLTINFGLIPALASGGVLVIPGALNLFICPWIGKGGNRAVLWCIFATLAAFLYLAYLMVTGVPDHPIMLFTLIVGAYLVLLISVWNVIRRTNNS